MATEFKAADQVTRERCQLLHQIRRVLELAMVVLGFVELALLVFELIGRLAASGGAARWQHEVGNSFPVLQDAATGVTRIDVNNPYMGPTDLKFDGWIGYPRKLFDDKVTWRVQLNVRHLADDDDLIPLAAQPDGPIAAWRIPSPRTFSLRSTFEF